MQVPLAFGLLMSDDMRVDMWLGAGLWHLWSVSVSVCFHCHCLLYCPIPERRRWMCGARYSLLFVV